jgi:type I restriction enzyme S subunit
MNDAPGIDIAPADLEHVRTVLKRHVPDRDVWVFGSRATWKARPFSDLDLVIMGDTPLPLETSGALRDDFSESDLPFKVDIVEWAKTGPAFRAIIMAHKVVLVRST